jgi:hypothetical protein
MCSLDGRSGTNIGAIPRERNKQAWKEHIYHQMRAGKDNLAIPFIGWKNQKEVIFCRLLNKLASKAAAV